MDAFSLCTMCAFSARVCTDALTLTRLPEHTHHAYAFTHTHKQTHIHTYIPQHALAQRQPHIHTSMRLRRVKHTYTHKHAYKPQKHT